MIAQILMDVQPIKIADKWFVRTTMNGHELKQHGPFADETAAKTAASKLIAHWQPKTSTVLAPTSDDTITLNGKLTKIDSTEGAAFLRDACRAGEGILSDESLCQIYNLSPNDLEKMTENKTLIAALRAEGRRRVSSGARTKEAATQRLTKAPQILDDLMSSDKTPVRGRVDSIRELRAISAGTGDESPAQAAELFRITFNLNGNIEQLDKVVTPKPLPPTIEGEIDVGE